MVRFVVDRVVAAPQETVWRLLDDSASWPSWTPIASYACERPAGPDGLGEVRVFRNGRYRMREQITGRRAPNHLAYTVLSGLAVRDYRAAIDLGAAGDRTHVHWETTFATTVPGLGRLYRRALLRATRGFVAGLAARAAELARA